MSDLRGKVDSMDAMLARSEVTPADRITVYEADLPQNVLDQLLQLRLVAMDLETTGLRPNTDKLALIQFCDSSGNVVLLHRPSRDALNLRRLLSSASTEFIFHYARFDLAFLASHLQLEQLPTRIACTKVAARVLMDSVQPASLKDLLARFVGIDLSKNHAVRVSAWDRELSNEQLQYAASDVRWLIPLWDRLRKELQRLDRLERAEFLLRGVPPLALSDALGLERLFDY